jgi:hypothetical protein
MWESVGRYNHLLLGPSVPADDSHAITPFLAFQQVSTGHPQGLVHGFSISGWAMTLYHL